MSHLPTNHCMLFVTEAQRLTGTTACKKKSHVAIAILLVVLESCASLNVVACFLGISNFVFAGTANMQMNIWQTKISIVTRMLTHTHTYTQHEQNYCCQHPVETPLPVSRTQTTIVYNESTVKVRARKHTANRCK